MDRSQIFRCSGKHFCLSELHSETLCGSLGVRQQRYKAKKVVKNNKILVKWGSLWPLWFPNRKPVVCTHVSEGDSCFSYSEKGKKY